MKAIELSVAQPHDAQTWRSDFAHDVERGRGRTSYEEHTPVVAAPERNGSEWGRRKDRRWPAPWPYQVAEREEYRENAVNANAEVRLVGERCQAGTRLAHEGSPESGAEDPSLRAQGVGDVRARKPPPIVWLGGVARSQLGLVDLAQLHDGSVHDGVQEIDQPGVERIGQSGAQVDDAEAGNEA